MVDFDSLGGIHDKAMQENWLSIGSFKLRV